MCFWREIDYNLTLNTTLPNFGPVGSSEISGKFPEFIINSGNSWWNFSEIPVGIPNLKVPVNYWDTTEFFNLLKFYGILVIPTTEIPNLVRGNYTLCSEWGDSLRHLIAASRGEIRKYVTERKKLLCRVSGSETGHRHAEWTVVQICYAEGIRTFYSSWVECRSRKSREYCFPTNVGIRVCISRPLQSPSEERWTRVAIYDDIRVRNFVSVPSAFTQDF